MQCIVEHSAFLRSECSIMHLNQFTAVHFSALHCSVLVLESGGGHSWMAAARAPKCVARYQIRRSDPWWSLLSLLLPSRFPKVYLFLCTPQYHCNTNFLTCVWRFGRVNWCHLTYFYIQSSSAAFDLLLCRFCREFAIWTGWCIA